MLSLGAKPLLGWGTLWTLVVLGVASGLMTPAVFYVFDRLRVLFQYSPLETTSFREDREIKRGRR